MRNFGFAIAIILKIDDNRIKQRGIISMQNKQIVYRYYRYNGKPLQAKREIPYEIKITTRLLLDELCFKWNKEKLAQAIDDALERGDEFAFKKLSEKYSHYIWE